MEEKIKYPAGGMGFCIFFSVVYCPVEVSATGRSLVQRNTTDCGIAAKDRRQV
jgi:hypothetical protein